jgi:hypothetical protein
MHRLVVAKGNINININSRDNIYHDADMHILATRSYSSMLSMIKAHDLDMSC